MISLALLLPAPRSGAVLGFDLCPGFYTGRGIAKTLSFVYVVDAIRKGSTTLERHLPSPTWLT